MSCNTILVACLVHLHYEDQECDHVPACVPRSCWQDDKLEKIQVLKERELLSGPRKENHGPGCKVR